MRESGDVRLRIGLRRDQYQLVLVLLPVGANDHINSQAVSRCASSRTDLAKPTFKWRVRTDTTQGTGRLIQPPDGTG